MSLCYNPTANTITVNIIKARNLKAMDIGGTSGTESSLFVQSLSCLTLGHQSEPRLVTLEALWLHTHTHTHLHLRVLTFTGLSGQRTVAVWLLSWVAL